MSFETCFLYIKCHQNLVHVLKSYLPIIFTKSILLHIPIEHNMVTNINAKIFTYNLRRIIVEMGSKM